MSTEEGMATALTLALVAMFVFAGIKLGELRIPHAFTMLFG